jgi:hypothetical protein
MERLKIGLPPELRNRLDVASAASDKTLAVEIRDRLERSFREDEIDPVSRELRQFVADTAAAIVQNFGVSWYSQPKAHAVFAMALAEQIAGYEPEPSGGMTDLLGPDDPPATIAKMLVKQVRRDRAHPHLDEQARKSQQRKAARILGRMKQKEGKQ